MFGIRFLELYYYTLLYSLNKEPQTRIGHSLGPFFRPQPPSRKPKKALMLGV